MNLEKIGFGLCGVCSPFLTTSTKAGKLTSLVDIFMMPEAYYVKTNLPRKRHELIILNLFINRLLFFIGSWQMARGLAWAPAWGWRGEWRMGAP